MEIIEAYATKNRCYQMAAPLTPRGWHCGGSANNTHDDLSGVSMPMRSMSRAQHLKTMGTNA